MLLGNTPCFLPDTNHAVQHAIISDYFPTAGRLEKSYQGARRGLGALRSCFYSACLCFIFHVLSRCTVKGDSVTARADVVVETDIGTSYGVC